MVPGGRGGGRPQRVPDKFIKYEEKTEMRETTKNQDPTNNLQSFARTKNDSTVNKSILVVGSRRNEY